MKTLFRRCWSLALVLASGITILLGQDSARVVILSSRIGPEIDPQERVHFRIFPEIKGFQHAVMYQRTDGSYYLHAVYQLEKNTVQDTIIDYSEHLVYMLAEKINHFEDLLEGTYTLGSDRAVLTYIDGRGVSQTERGVHSEQILGRPRYIPEKLPLIPDSAQEYLVVDYPRCGFGIGLSSYSPDFSGIVQSYTEVEENLRQQGYNVGHHVPSFNIAGVFWLDFTLQCSHTLSLLGEVGVQAGGNAKFNAASLSIEEILWDGGPHYPHPFIGVGIGHYRLAMDEGYHVQLTAYSTFDALEIRAAHLGYNFDLGIEGGTDFVWSVGGRYLYIPDVTKPTAQGVDARISMKSFAVGAKFLIYF